MTLLLPQQSAVPRLSVDAMEFTCAEKLQDIPEETTHALPTVHTGCLNWPSITLPTIPRQVELHPLCPLARRARAKTYCTMTGPKYQTNVTCDTQRPVPFHGQQAPETSVSLPIMNQHQQRPCGSACLGLRQRMPTTKHPLSSLEAGRGLKACHALMSCGHATHYQHVWPI